MKKIIASFAAFIVITGFTAPTYSQTPCTWGYMDKTGNIAITPQFEMAFAFSEGLAAVMKDDLWGFIDRTGSIVIENTYQRAYTFSDGLALVSTDNQNYYYIDKTGRIVLDPDNECADMFNEGLTVVCTGDKLRITRIQTYTVRNTP